MVSKEICVGCEHSRQFYRHIKVSEPDYYSPDFSTVLSRCAHPIVVGAVVKSGVSSELPGVDVSYISICPKV